jgi:hypothetical protein
VKSLDKFYDRAKKTWFATQDVGRGSALTLDMPPIREATRDAEMYLARRRAAARGAHVRAQHAVHAGSALGAGAAPRA